MVKFKELSKLSKSDINDKINEINLELIKARVSAGKGGKVKMREMKKTLARLLMLKHINKK
ncbi:MAG: 50S ribosomal protein L29 [Nanoarchaeota archaeon]